MYSKISTDPGLLKIRHSHRFVAVVIQILIPSLSLAFHVIEERVGPSTTVEKEPEIDVAKPSLGKQVVPGTGTLSTAGQWTISGQDGDLTGQKLHCTRPSFCPVTSC